MLSSWRLGYEQGRLGHVLKRCLLFWFGVLTQGFLAAGFPVRAWNLGFEVSDVMFHQVFRLGS